MISLPLSGSSKRLGESWHEAIDQSDSLAVKHIYGKLKDQYSAVTIIIDGRSLGSVRAAQRVNHPDVYKVKLVAPLSALDVGIQSYLGSAAVKDFLLKIDSWYFSSDLDKHFNVTQMIELSGKHVDVYASTDDEYFGTHIKVSLSS
jgi:hypothetical protein